MEHLISQFIDDELNLDEKFVFVKQVHDGPHFFTRALGLLQTEKVLRADPVEAYPDALPAPRASRRITFSRFLPLAAALAAVLVFSVYLGTRAPDAPQTMPYRFVIYLPDATEAEIVGSFTDWKALSLQPSGRSGYWEISLPLPPGEHRYCYSLNNGRRIPDPTVPDREQDDFGGENSVLRLETT